MVTTSLSLVKSPVGVAMSFYLKLWLFFVVFVGEMETLSKEENKP